MQDDKVQSIVDDYTTAGYVYYCETKKLDAALTDPVWAVSRLTVATGREVWANGNDNYTNIAANRASLSYPS